MTAMLTVVAAAWLWLGLVPQLVLGRRRRTNLQLLGEWLAGPIGLVTALGHRRTPPAA